jgi:hypothetical protein
LRACCIPLPTMGFAWFRACRRPPKWPNRQTFLTSAHPSELFPPLRPNPVTPTLLPGSPKPVPLSSLLPLQARKPAAPSATPGV